MQYFYFFINNFLLINFHQYIFNFFFCEMANYNCTTNIVVLPNDNDEKEKVLKILNTLHLVFSTLEKNQNVILPISDVYICPGFPRFFQETVSYYDYTAEEKENKQPELNLFKLHHIFNRYDEDIILKAFLPDTIVVILAFEDEKIYQKIGRFVQEKSFWINYFKFNFESTLPICENGIKCMQDDNIIFISIKKPTTKRGYQLNKFSNENQEKIPAIIYDVKITLDFRRAYEKNIKELYIPSYNIVFNNEREDDHLINVFYSDSQRSTNNAVEIQITKDFAIKCKHIVKLQTEIQLKKMELLNFVKEYDI